MRLTQAELGVVALLIAYIAFGTHPAPSHLVDFLSTSVGKIFMLVAVLYVTVYQSLIVGVFLALAFVLTVQQVTEYLDPKEQTPKEAKQPTSSGVPPPAVMGALASMLKKGDTRLPQTAQKKGTPAVKPPVSMPTVKPASKAGVETFASF